MTSTATNDFIDAVHRDDIDAMIEMLNDPRVDASAMLMQTDEQGLTALMHAVGNIGMMRVLLDHPAACPAAMLAMRDRSGQTVFVRVASNMRHGPNTTPDRTWRCETILFLLRHADLRPSAKDLNLVMSYMEPLLDDDVPIEHCDECVRTLLGLGAPLWARPATARIVHELLHERARLIREVAELRSLTQSMKI